MSSLDPRARRLVAAPSPTHPSLRSLVLNVECADDQEVLWLWTETPAGSFVCGYELVAKNLSQRVAQLRGMPQSVETA